MADVVRYGNIYGEGRGTGFAGNVWDQNHLCPTLTTMQGGNREPMAVVNNKKYRIRKLTPLECFRLMGFKDEDFNKAAYVDKNLLGDDVLLNAKLTGVIEKQKQRDMETYVLNTTKGLADMGICPIEMKLFTNSLSLERTPSANVVIEKWGKQVRLGCATSITKCLENMETLCGLMEEIDQQATAIIELESRDKQNIGRYMKITSAENLTPMRLFTILTAIELITGLKTSICIPQKVSIQGLTLNCENLEKSMGKIPFSCSEMVGTFTRTSSSQLYKQAGNSIVVDVPYHIYKELHIAMPYLFDDLKVGSYFSGIGAFESALDRLYDDINSGRIEESKEDKFVKGNPFADLL